MIEKTLSRLVATRHPLYRAWIRARNKGAVPEWHRSFWAFAEGVGTHGVGSWWALRRNDTAEPYGPGNAFWRQIKRPTVIARTGAKPKTERSPTEGFNGRRFDEPGMVVTRTRRGSERCG